MKIVGVIPARFASTRLPGKPLQKLAGKPLIQWVIEGCQQSRLLSEVIVATDHKEIFELALACGVRAVMTHPELPSGSDRVYAAIADLDIDVVINIQGDEPLVSGSLIDSLAREFVQEPSLKMATLSTDLELQDLANLNVVKLVTNQLRNALYFSRFSIPHSRLQPSEMGKFACQRHLGMYGYSKKFLKEFCQAEPCMTEKAESLEQLRALHLGAQIRVVYTQEISHGVDTPEDLVKVEKILMRRGDSFEK